MVLVHEGVSDSQPSWMMTVSNCMIYAWIVHTGSHVAKNESSLVNHTLYDRVYAMPAAAPRSVFCAHLSPYLLKVSTNRGHSICLSLALLSNIWYIHSLAVLIRYAEKRNPISKSINRYFIDIGHHPLSHWGRVTHICVSELHHHWFR